MNCTEPTPFATILPRALILALLLALAASWVHPSVDDAVESFVPGVEGGGEGGERGHVETRANEPKALTAAELYAAEASPTVPK